MIILSLHHFPPKNTNFSLNLILNLSFKLIFFNSSERMRKICEFFVEKKVKIFFITKIAENFQEPDHSGGRKNLFENFHIFYFG